MGCKYNKKILTLLHGVEILKAKEGYVHRKIQNKKKSWVELQGYVSSSFGTSRWTMVMSQLSLLILHVELSLDFGSVSALSLPSLPSNEPSPPFYRIQEAFSQIKLVGVFIYSSMHHAFIPPFTLYFFLNVHHSST